MGSLEVADVGRGGQVSDGVAGGVLDLVLAPEDQQQVQPLHGVRFSADQQFGRRSGRPLAAAADSIDFFPSDLCLCVAGIQPAIL